MNTPQTCHFIRWFDQSGHGGVLGAWTDSTAAWRVLDILNQHGDPSKTFALDSKPLQEANMESLMTALHALKTSGLDDDYIGQLQAITEAAQVLIGLRQSAPPA